MSAKSENKVLSQRAIPYKLYMGLTFTPIWLETIVDLIYILFFKTSKLDGRSDVEFMAIVSRIIKATLDAELIKLADENAALKNRRYIPYWA